MSPESPSFSSYIKKSQERLDAFKHEIGKVIVGQRLLIDRLLIGLLADGHLLLEGVPGVAKTLAANTMAKILDCDFKRIQFTPDLLPADLIGTSIYNPKEGIFTVKKGPLFTHMLLADEINRAPAKVQSALLEVMQEKQITIGGETFRLPEPFLVIATQNPIEQEGTYPLSEAQTDRFMMKVNIHYPAYEEEKEILRRLGSLAPLPKIEPLLSKEELFQLREGADAIYVDDQIADYILNIVVSTRDPHLFDIPIGGLLDYGASPRASLALKKASKAQAFLEGRSFVKPEDVKKLAPDVLRHRLRLSYEAEAENLSADDIIRRILHTVPVP